MNILVANLKIPKSMAGRVIETLVYGMTRAGEGCLLYHCTSQPALNHISLPELCHAIFLSECKLFGGVIA